jgi:hypothetical protein
MLASLLSHVGDDIYAMHAMLPQSAMPRKFLDSVRQCGKFFADCTQRALHRTLAMQDLHTAEARAINDMQTFCGEQWLQKFKVQPISPEMRLSPVRCPL